MHQTLSNNGYKHVGYGEKTKWALYKNDAGAKVYVKSDGQGYEWYPKGTVAGADTQISQGASNLQTALTTKPNTETGMYTATPSTTGSTTVDSKGFTMPGSYDWPEQYVKVSAISVGAEAKALKEYQNGLYDDTNKYLYSGKVPAYAHKDQLDERIKNIDSAFHKSIANENFVIWRKVDLQDKSSELAIAVKNAKPGDILSPKSFQSSSISQNVWNGDTLFRIRVPKGTPAIAYKASIPSFHQSGEREILLSRHVQYVVNGIESKGFKTIVDVDVLNNSDVKHLKSV
jgi:hypothetical protein